MPASLSEIGTLALALAVALDADVPVCAGGGGASPLFTQPAPDPASPAIGTARTQRAAKVREKNRPAFLRDPPNVLVARVITE